MYRRTKKYVAECEKLKASREAKERKRLEGPAPDYPPDLPQLRKRITIETFDFGHETHVLELHKTNRIDCYDVFVDGKLWKTKIGISRVMEWIRKASPRLLSSRNQIG